MRLEHKQLAAEKKYRIVRDSSGEIFCIVTLPKSKGTVLETYHVPKIRLVGREDSGTTDDGAQNLAASILADMLDVSADKVEREFFSPPQRNRARAVCALRTDFAKDYIKSMESLPDEGARTITGFEILLWLALPRHCEVLRDLA